MGSNGGVRIAARRLFTELCSQTHKLFWWDIQIHREHAPQSLYPQNLLFEGNPTSRLPETSGSRLRRSARTTRLGAVHLHLRGRPGTICRQKSRLDSSLEARESRLLV